MRRLSAAGRLRVASRVAFAALVAGGAVACSLINSFDDVKPAVTVASDATVDAPIEAGSEGGDAGPSEGVIVIGGVAEEDGGHVPVLTALSPASGAELPMARVKLLVAALHYDGLRDLWYVFESNGATHFPTPSDAVFLHIRRLDALTGAWEEIQSIKVPTLVANTHVAVLRERLAYIAYRTDADGQVGNDLVVINTEDPSQPSLIGSPTPLVGSPIGVIGTRGGATAGGSITLLYDASQGLDAGICGGAVDGGGPLCLESQLVKVASEGLPSVGPLREVGTHIGSPAFGSFLGNGSPINYVGFSATPPAGVLQGYTPVNGQPVGTQIKFQIGDPYLRPIAFADCLGQALLIGTNTETAVTAVPVTTAGVGDRAVMDHSGQSVHFEPFTSTVLAPFTQGEGFELTAFKLGGAAGAPKLTLRQAPEWSPPAHLRPEIVATRIPVPFTCPAAP
jgi:hypothetical protein